MIPSIPACPQTYCLNALFYLHQTKYTLRPISSHWISTTNLRFSGSCGISSFSDWLCICWISDWSIWYYNLNTKLQKYEFSYKFNTVLYQFLVTGTSDRCLKGIFQRLRFSGFSLYPLSFFLYSPFKLLFSDILQTNYNKIVFYKYTIHMAYLLSVSFACI